MEIEKPKTLLLVEDEAVIAMLEVQQLKSAGYKVIHVSNGLKAIDLICVKNEPVDLILMDIDLGKGMDGTETALEILKTKKIPILFLSSHTEKEIVEKTEKITSYGYVVKDSNSTVLETSIKMAFKLFNVITERTQMQRALKESEERLLLAHKATNDVIWDWDIINNKQLWNEAGAFVFGWTDIIHEPQSAEWWVEKVHPDDREKVDREFFEAVNDPNCNNWSAQYRFLKKDNSYALVMDRGYIIRDSDGKAIRMIGAMIDITKLKQAEEAVKESEELYRYMFENNPQPMLVYDLESLNILQVNNAAIEHYGYSKEEFLSLNVKDIRPKEDIDRLMENIKLARQNQNTKGEWRHIKKNGEIINVEVSAHSVSFNNRNARYVLINDITSSKRSEEKLKKSEAKYHQLYKLFRLMSDTMPDMLWAKDIEKKYIFANKAICQKLLNARDTEEPIGKTDMFFAERERNSHPENTDWHTFGEMCRDSDSVVLKEMKEMQFDEFGNVKGKFLFLDVRKAPLFDDAGKLIGVVGTGRDITAAKAAADALKESEGKYRLLTESIKDVIWVIDVDSGYFTYVSPSIKQIKGYSPEEIMAMPFADSLAPMHIDVINNLIKERTKQFIDDPLLEQSCFYTDEFEQPQKGGTYVWTEVITKFIRNRKTGRIELHGVSRDISKRKKAEAALKEREHNYSEIFNSTSEAIFIDDAATGQMIDVNNAMLKLYGYSTKEEVLAGNIGDLSANIEPYTEEYAQEMIAKTLTEGPQTFEWLAKKKDGTIFWIEMTLKKTEMGGLNRILAVGRDITARKKAEERLRESELKYRLLIDHTSDLIWSLDAHGIFIYISPSWKRVTGYEPDSLVGTSFRQIVHLDDIEACNNYLNDMITLKEVLPSPEYRVIHSDGSINWHVATSTPVLGPGGEFLYIVGVSRNISDQKQTEEKILKLLLEKELILKEVHHRIKNNMNTIYALLMLHSDVQKDALSKNSLVDAAGRVQSMMVLYDKLYRSENINAISVNVFLRSVICEVVKLFPQAADVVIELDLEDIILNSQILSSIGIIINELFTNAMKYAFNGKGNNIIKIAGYKKDNRMTISFEDNGVGLPPSVTAINSSGFGLQLVDMLVQQIDGAVRTERGNGTKYIIEFNI